MTQNLLQVVLSLVAVIGLFLVMAWLMRRFAQGPGMGARHIKILSAINLGTKEKLLVVDVEGQQLVLGVTGQQISTLHTFAQPAITVDDKKPASDFSKKLQTILSRTNLNRTVLNPVGISAANIDSEKNNPANVSEH